MKELVEFIAGAIVDHPDQVQVEEQTAEDGSITFELICAEVDKGRIIGKNGRVIQSIRSVLMASARKENKWVRLTLR